MAGRNWIFASQPNQVCIVPVKSRNSRVMRVNMMAARTVLIFRSICQILLWFDMSESEDSADRVMVGNVRYPAVLLPDCLESVAGGES